MLELIIFFAIVIFVVVWCRQRKQAEFKKTTKPFERGESLEIKALAKKVALHHGKELTNYYQIFRTPYKMPKN